MSKCPLYKDGKCEISEANCITGDFAKEKCCSYGGETELPEHIKRIIN